MRSEAGDAVGFLALARPELHSTRPDRVQRRESASSPGIVLGRIPAACAGFWQRRVSRGAAEIAECPGARAITKGRQRADKGADKGQAHHRRRDTHAI